MPRFIRLGQFYVSIEHADKITGLEESFVVSGEAAEKLRAWFHAHSVPWKPVVIGSHPRGPLDAFGRRLE